MLANNIVFLVLDRVVNISNKRIDDVSSHKKKECVSFVDSGNVNLTSLSLSLSHTHTHTHIHMRFLGLHPRHFLCLFVLLFLVLCTFVSLLDS